MLQTGARTSPFRELSDRINYFAAFVASRESGISSLSPVERFLVAGGPAEAIEVDVAVLADDAVGTPTNPPLPPLVGVPPTPATNTRFLLNELDTAFGARVGERPRAERFDEIRTAALSERRFDEDDFDDFLAALLDPGGGNLGQHFKQHGKDDVAVLVLCRSDHNGGANAPRAESGAIICLTLGVEEIFRINPAAGGRGQDIVTDPIPARVHVEVRTCAAHELAHSFTLGDEYGGGGPLPRELPRGDRDPCERPGTHAGSGSRRTAAPPRPRNRGQARRGPDQVALAAPREGARAQRRAGTDTGHDAPPAAAQHRPPVQGWTTSCDCGPVHCRPRWRPERLKVIAPVGAAEIDGGAGWRAARRQLSRGQHRDEAPARTRPAGRTGRRSRARARRRAQVDRLHVERGARPSEPLERRRHGTGEQPRARPLGSPAIPPPRATTRWASPRPIPPSGVRVDHRPVRDGQGLRLRGLPPDRRLHHGRARRSRRPGAPSSSAGCAATRWWTSSIRPCTA